MERWTRMRLETVGILLLVFGAGVALGIVADRTLLDAGEDRRREARREHDRERGERSLVIDRVEMSADQRARVDSIVEHHRKTIEGLWSEFRPRLREVAGETRSDIKEVLTPEQRARYDSLLDEVQRHRKDRDGKGKDDDGREGER